MVFSQQVYSFVRGLRQTPRSTGPLFNPWYDTDKYDASRDAPKIRRKHLTAYLQARAHAQYLFIAEAVGYQGGKFSGIAMTSERMLLGHHRDIRPEFVVPGNMPRRTSNRAKGRSKKAQQYGFTEPTATIVWRTLVKKVGLCPFQFVLWNAVPWHPHEKDCKLSNRTPSEMELCEGMRHISSLCSLFPSAHVVPVGEKAKEALTNLGFCNCAVRHPANGGAKDFGEDVKKILQTTRPDVSEWDTDHCRTESISHHCLNGSCPGLRT